MIREYLAQRAAELRASGDRGENAWADGRPDGDVVWGLIQASRAASAIFRTGALGITAEVATALEVEVHAPMAIWGTQTAATYWDFRSAHPQLGQQPKADYALSGLATTQVAIPPAAAAQM